MKAPAPKAPAAGDILNEWGPSYEFFRRSILSQFTLWPFWPNSVAVRANSDKLAIRS